MPIGPGVWVKQIEVAPPDYGEVERMEVCVDSDIECESLTVAELFKVADALIARALLLRQAATVGE